MKAKLDSLTQQLLDAARKAGADNADALAVAGTSLSIDVLKGALEHAERSESVDIGLRVMVGHRQANVSASDTSADTSSAPTRTPLRLHSDTPSASMQPCPRPPTRPTT